MFSPIATKYLSCLGPQCCSSMMTVVMQTQKPESSSKNSSLPTTTCPNCRMTWLTPGLSEGDQYECKKCSSSFVVGKAFNNNPAANLLVDDETGKQAENN